MKEIIYFGDPMCSWCYGFSATLRRLDEAYGDVAPIELVMGGLRPFNTTVMGEAEKEQFRGYWEKVSQLTGASFNYDFFERDGFVLDTEPAARAVVAFRKLSMPNVLSFYESIAKGYYQDNRDPTSTDNLVALAGEAGANEAAFADLFASDSTKQETIDEFRKAKAFGVTGFPTVIVKEGTGDDVLYALLTAGFRPFDLLGPVIDRWLEVGLAAMVEEQQGASGS